MLLSGFTILDLSSSMAHGLPKAMQHAASCPEGVLVGTGYIHLPYISHGRNSLGNGPDDALLNKGY